MTGRDGDRIDIRYCKCGNSIPRPHGGGYFCADCGVTVFEGNHLKLGPTGDVEVFEPSNID